MSNDQLKSQIENALRNEPTLSNANVAVAVTDSNIDLSGSVPTANDKQTAERIAQSYSGNRQLSDHLNIASSSGMSPQGTSGMSGASTGTTSTSPSSTSPSSTSPSSTTPQTGSTPPQR
jgi:BON domain-containing protein